MNAIEYVSIVVCPVLAVILARMPPQDHSRLLVLGEDYGILGMGSSGALGIHFLSEGKPAGAVLATTIVFLLLAGIAVAFISQLKQRPSVTWRQGGYALLIGGAIVGVGPLVLSSAIDALSAVQ